MTPEQREELIRLLQQGENLSPQWARILFPPEKREDELVYHGKEREEDILANTLAVPVQPVRNDRTRGINGVATYQPKATPWVLRPQQSQQAPQRRHKSPRLPACRTRRYRLQLNPKNPTTTEPI